MRLLLVDFSGKFRNIIYFCDCFYIYLVIYTILLKMWIICINVFKVGRVFRILDIFPYYSVFLNVYLCHMAIPEKSATLEKYSNNMYVDVLNFLMNSFSVSLSNWFLSVLIEKNRKTTERKEFYSFFTFHSDLTINYSWTLLF